MKIFTTIFFSLCVVFVLFTSTSRASSTQDNFSIITQNSNENKVFKLYFKNGFLKEGDKEKIKSALLEKAHINDIVISNQDGFDIFTIKTEQYIEKKNITTIVNRLGFYFDKKGSISLIQD
ncbi:MAG: hypothetical protein V4667_01320 [Bacteroidota bacterium]